MSARIGDVFTTHNGGFKVAEIWASRGGVEMRFEPDAARKLSQGLASLDPIAARNAAALLVRASEEVERIRERSQP